ncbi:MAG: hypothetical protein V3T58_06800 [Candidatus Hydrothermarchaeales archaeon]
MKRQMLILAGIYVILFVGLFATASASEAAKTEPTRGVEVQEVGEVGHGEGEVHEEEHGAPFVYWFFWLFAFLAIAYLVQYIKNIKKMKHGKETKYETSRYILTIGIFAAGAIVISLMPAVAHYHEPTIVGFSRFLIMIVISLLLMVYGFREHESHKHMH